SAERLGQRRGLLAEVDSQRRELAAGASQFNDYYEQAYGLVASAEARAAFDVAQESAALRERYGASAFGQGLLLARRLVESGVRLVTVNWARDDAFWDTHSQ